MHPRVLAAAALLFAASPLARPQAPTIPVAPQSSATQDSSAASAQPLPDAASLLARVRARYIALEALRKNYIFTITQVADEFSASGSKSTHTDQYQAFFVEKNELMQHITRDGKPLSPEAAKKEQERIDKETARLKARETKPDRNTISLSASKLLKVATFSNPRREQIDGRPTIVFDYKGNPDAKADDLSEQIMRELAGTLWVDERDSAILRLNGSLQRNFHVAGGLFVNIRKGSWFDFTQTPVNGEIWFPKSFVVHVAGRFLLVKGFNGDAHDTFSDYRKLKTTVTLLPGSRPVDETGHPLPESAPEPAPPAAPASATTPTINQPHL